MCRKIIKSVLSLACAQTTLALFLTDKSRRVSMEYNDGHVQNRASRQHVILNVITSKGRFHLTNSVHQSNLKIGWLPQHHRIAQKVDQHAKQCNRTSAIVCQSLIGKETITNENSIPTLPLLNSILPSKSFMNPTSNSVA